MKLAKLLHMGPAEIAGRGRRAAMMRFERFVSDAGLDGREPSSLLEVLNGDPALAAIRHRLRSGRQGEAARQLFSRFRTRGARRFFAGAVAAETTKRVAEHAPGARGRVIATADAVCARRFPILGYGELSFGDPVDWHLDPVSGRRAPVTHFSRIDPLDAAAVGDSKVVWELNRHQWLVDLGQAYRMTGDERYADAFIELLGEWMRDNPPGTGINWASSLEVAFRLIAWCWALFFFKDSKALTPARFVQLAGWIRVHAVHVERYLSHYFSPNTHLTGEALGLFYAGVIFPELEGAGGWRETGARILIEQLPRQVLPDGVYFEQSTHYQRYTAEIYLHFLILAGRNGIALPAAVTERTQQTLDFLLALMRPDGSVPQVGDTDGGWLLPLQRRGPEDHRGLFAIAAALFRRADYAWAARGIAPEALWLLGAPAIEAFERLDAKPPARNGFHLFPRGGYAVMRSGWEKDAHQLVFDAGPLGCPVSGAHGHADLLGIQLCAFGEPVLVDSGTGSYTGERAWRDYFRSTAAHSSVSVDGESQAEPAGPFSWRQKPRARFRRRISTDEYDLVDADHDAYRRLADPVVHRRRVFFARPRYFVIVDDLDGRAEHDVALHFQFAPAEISLNRNGWVRARLRSGRGLLLKSFAAVPLTPVLSEAGSNPMRGWISPDYGRREPAPSLAFKCRARLPLRLVTLLLPAASASAALPRADPVGDGAAAGIELSDWNERVGIGAHDIYIERC